jgi:RNA polymerase subunit RPABC4/transcription elongation factor Spt4
MNDLKKYKKCKKCGVKWEDNIEKCPGCGSVSFTESVEVCVECGTNIENETDWCPFCKMKRNLKGEEK